MTIWKIQFHHISNMGTFLKQNVTCATIEFWKGNSRHRFKNWSKMCI